MWCSLVWLVVGVGVLAEQSTRDPAYFHTLLPDGLRVTGWWVTAGLGAYGALSRRHARTAVAALMVMPLLRLTSSLWAWAMALIPEPPSGADGAWYSAIFYVFMVSVVMIAAHVKEPTRDPRGQ